MIVTNYTPEDLKKLPLRAIVALSFRCARRVEHLAVPDDDHPETQRCRAAVSNAIRLTEDFASGSPCSSPESVVSEVESCRAAAKLRFRAGQRAGDHRNCGPRRGKRSARARPPKRGGGVAQARARQGRSATQPGGCHGRPDRASAFTAAFEAVAADGHTDAFIKAAIEDYEKLLRLDLGDVSRCRTSRSTPHRRGRSGRRSLRDDAEHRRDRRVLV